ncbi:MAG: rhodanese-like domain-containing protein [Blastocatellia bacterium]
MKSKSICFVSILAVIVALGLSTSSAMQNRLNIFQTHLEEANQKTPELTTEELQALLAAGNTPILDVRSELEYSIAHIPGTVNLWEKEAENIQQLYPNRSTSLVLYCNGPFCGKSKRTSEQLIGLGYTNIRRYQIGMPVWRALGNTVETGLAGFRYMLRHDKTSILVDARGPEEFAQGTLPGAVNIRAGEADKANDDGRLPQWDKGTRVVVFANSGQEARVVATEVAKKAYWNSSYFGGAFKDLSAPELYTANVFGTGVAAAVALRVKANGAQSYEPVAQYSSTQYRFVPIPIDFGPETDAVYLALYGAGFRTRSSLAAVEVKIGGEASQVVYAGSVPGLVGLDQINVRLPRNLAGRGDVDVTLAVDGRAANVVKVSIK